MNSGGADNGGPDNGGPDNGGKDTAGVIAPPPVIYLAFLSIGFGADALWPVAVLPQGPRYAAGTAAIALGLALGFAAIHQFRRHDTSFKPHEPSTALIAEGPYRYSRNPIYLALSLVYAGIAIAADGPWTLALLVPLMVVLHYGVIIREERYLERKFADAYRRYKATVRRWV
ncbi:MAG: isoprenylcysteine carboxylmethyltransferase family protein [Proteobacteria bacterium]|nr:isoprenylcysteine carboxylmethyltransferase family protein [Pseudomonadota bacterium]